MRLHLAFALLLIVGMMAASWRPEDRPGLPLARPIGYCVSLKGSPFIFSPSRHRISAASRKEAGLQPLELSEFTDSVKAAAKLSALKSGNPNLIAATNGSFSFPDLGIPTTGATDTVCTCAMSNCYGQPSTCIPKSCDGACADCEECVVTGGGNTSKCRGRICTQ